MAVILQEVGMKEAPAGKHRLGSNSSLSVPVEQRSRAIYGDEDPANAQENACKLVIGMPNTAAVVHERMTAIAITTPPLLSDLSAVVEWIFTRIGRVPPTTQYEGRFYSPLRLWSWIPVAYDGKFGGGAAAMGLP
ncbi:delta 1-pyrroline-5-carboxylate reductase [Rhinocladiella similis]